MKTKLVVFDFDGTLTIAKKGDNCWRYVWEEIGATDVDDQLFKAFRKSKIDMYEWCIKVGNEFRSRGVNREMIERIAKSIKLRDGVEETFKALKEKGIKIFILSGGIKYMVECALEKVLPYIDEIESRDLKFYKRGGVSNVVALDHDTEHKHEYMYRLMYRFGLKNKEIFFVGNGKNDESARGTGVVTLCVAPDGTDPHDKNCWDYYIEDIQNMQQILPFIDTNEENSEN